MVLQTQSVAHNRTRVCAYSYFTPTIRKQQNGYARFWKYSKHMNLLKYLNIIIKVIILFDLPRCQDEEVNYKCPIYLRKLEFARLTELLGFPGAAGFARTLGVQR